MAQFPVRAGVITNPLGIRKEYPNDLRTWTQSRVTTVLRAKDTMATAFRKESYDLSPWQIPFSPDRTFANPMRLPLRGQDRMATAFRKEVYDRPPEPPARQPDLRTWIETPQAPATVIPAGVDQDWEFRTFQYPYSMALRTWIETPQLSATPIPSGVDQDWDFRSLRFPYNYPIDLRTWVESPQQSTPTSPFSQYDWPLPRAYPRIEQTWAETPPPTMVGPLPSYDWQVPPSMVSPQVPSWTQSLLPQSGAVAAPFSQDDWPNPIAPSYQIGLRTWLESFQPGSVKAPFIQYDWPLPRSYLRPDETWTAWYNLNLIGQDKLPSGKQVFDRTPIGYPSQVPSWSLFNLALIGKIPVGEIYFDRTPISNVPLIKSWEWWYNLNLIGQDRLPVGENFSERPPPVSWYRDWFINLQESTLAPAAARPFAQYDWPLSRLPPPLVPSWTLFPLASTTIVTGPLPSYDWQVPPSPLGNWAFVFVSAGLQSATTPVTVVFPPGAIIYALPQSYPPLVPSWSLFVPNIPTAAAPFSQLDWPLPRTYPRLDQTWSFSYDLNLIGKDQLLVGEQVSDRPQLPPWYRDWALDLQLSTLSSGTPTAQRDWPLPQFQPRRDQTWAFSYDLNLIGKDQLPTGEQIYELPRRYPLLVPNWSLFVPNIPTAAIPFAQLSWPLPQAQPRLDQTWSFSYDLNLIGKDKLPIGEQVYERPPPVQWYRDWSFSLQEIALSPVMIPSRLVGIDNPTGPIFLVSDLAQQNFLNLQVVLPAGENVYDLVPRSNIDRNTWTYSYGLNLIGKDQLPTGEQVSDRPQPPPWYRDWAQVPIKIATVVPPVGSSIDLAPRASAPLIKLWEGRYNLNLIGKDQLPVGENFSERPPPVNWLRDWALNLVPYIQSSVRPAGAMSSELYPRGRPPLVPSWTFSYDLNLIGKDRLPSGKQVYDLARGASPLLQTWLFFEPPAFNPGITQLPHDQYDWPLPRRYPPQVPSWAFSYDLNLIGKDQLPVGEIFSERPPPVNWYRDWSLNLQETILSVIGGPLLPGDWQVPPSMVGVHALTYTFNNANFSVVVAPPGELVFDLPPRGYPPQVPSWAFSYDLNLIGKDRLPTGQRSFDTPAQKERLPDLRNWYWSNVRVIGKDRFPTGQHSFDTPAQKARLPDLTNWYWSYNLRLIGKDKLPVGQRLYDVAPIGSAPLLKIWHFTIPIHVAVRPINQYDWPLPKQRPLLSQRATFANVSPLIPVITIGDLTLIANQSLNDFGTHDIYSSAITQIFLILDYPAQQNPQMIFERPDGSTFIEQFPYVSIGQFTMNTPKGLAVAGHYLIYNVVKSRFYYPGVWRAFAVTDGPGANFYVRNY